MRRNYPLSFEARDKQFLLSIPYIERLDTMKFNQVD